MLDAGLTLVYRGAIDDQHGLGFSLPEPRRRYLAEALEAALAARPPDVAATSAPGCLLDVKTPPVAAAGAAPAAITYHNRVSRIVQRHCQQCHRAGESAPFELAGYADVKGNLPMIKKVVAKGVMPPWFADKSVGHWINDRSLPDRDKADLLAWIDAGAPEGDAKDAAVPRAFAPGWAIGKPDAVFEAERAIAVPARGPIPYRYVTVPTNLKEDRWVRSIEIRTATPQVVHHLLVFVMYPKTDPRGKNLPDPRGGLSGYFAGMVPGSTSHTYPLGTAKLLPKGATLVLQVHYTPDGTAVEDRPKVGVVFADTAPQHELMTIAAFNNRFRIPPGDPNYEIGANYRFRSAARLYSFSPHSHLRGKAFRYELTYPDGRTQVVLDVPRYDFNWQLEYRLRDPIDVPAGTRLQVTGWYDNSKENPANPDPTKMVRFGEQTNEEMMIGYFTGHRLP